MTPKESISHDLKVPSGCWQLFSYGELSGHAEGDATEVSALLRRVDLGPDGNIRSRGNEVISRKMPAGDIVLLGVGRVFDGDSKRNYPTQPIWEGMEQLEVEVEFTDENCDLSLHRNSTLEFQGEGEVAIANFECAPTPERYSSVVHKHIFRNPVLAERTESSNSRFMRSTCTDGKVLVIPCATILGTFWGGSSRIVNMLLDGKFGDFSHEVVSLGRSRFDFENKTAYLWLRQHSLNDDVPFLASIASDKVAISRGENIGSWLHSPNRIHGQNPVRHIIARPPHVQKVKLTVQCLKVNSLIGQYYYVQSILKSSYVPPFNLVAFGRDNDNRKAADEGLDTLPKMPMDRARIPTGNAKEGSGLSGEQPGAIKAAEPTAVTPFKSIFPGFAAVESYTPDKLQTFYENESAAQTMQRYNKWWEVLSTLPGSAKSAQDILGTDLVSGSGDAETNPRLPAGPNLSLLVGAYEQYRADEKAKIDQRRAIREEFLGNQDGNALIKVVARQTLEDVERDDGYYLFALPALGNGKTPARLHSDPDRHRRKLALCLELHFRPHGEAATRAGYVIGIEGRFQKPRLLARVPANKSKDPIPIFHPITLVWREQGTGDNPRHSVLLPEEIQFIFSKAVDHPNLSIAESQMPQGCRATIYHHKGDEIDFNDLAEGLSEKLKPLDRS